MIVWLSTIYYLECLIPGCCVYGGRHLFKKPLWHYIFLSSLLLLKVTVFYICRCEASLCYKPISASEWRSCRPLSGQIQDLHPSCYSLLCLPIISFMASCPWHNWWTHNIQIQIMQHKFQHYKYAILLLYTKCVYDIISIIREWLTKAQWLNLEFHKLITQSFIAEYNKLNSRWATILNIVSDLDN